MKVDQYFGIKGTSQFVHLNYDSDECSMVKTDTHVYVNVKPEHDEYATIKVRVLVDVKGVLNYLTTGDVDQFTIALDNVNWSALGAECTYPLLKPC
jgi:hypothetical protein